MNKTISIIRIVMLFSLGISAFFLILGKEQDANLPIWTFRVVIDKALGLGVIFLIARLYKRWSKIDPWLLAYKKMCDKVMENPNPMCIKDSED